MSYATVQDVLDYSKTIHIHARNLYEQLRDQTNRERVDMLLKLLAEHENKLAESMTSVAEHASDKALSEWHQFEAGSVSEALKGCKECHPDMSVEELVVIALKIDDYLISLYRYLASEATSDETRQMFESLVALEESEKMQTVRMTLSVNDW